MPAEAFGLVLTASVLHAGWNVLLRGSEDVETKMAVLLVLSVLLFAPVAAATWSVSWTVVPYIASSSALEGIYFGLIVMAYRRQELSVVYPVARGSAPVLVLLGSAIVLGRGVTGAEACGVCLIAAGILLLRGLHRPVDGLAVGLGIGVAIAAYTLVDKSGIRHAATVPYIELVLAPCALAATAVVVARRGMSVLVAELRPLTALAALASFSAYGLVLMALRIAAAPDVAAVRETSVVIAAALAAVVLRERVTVARFVGTCVVALGVSLLVLS
jgi:drug/metabolite transporter (DMT)-like permease